MVKSRSFIATPPGATIKEHWLKLGLIQKKFAVKMSMTAEYNIRLSYVAV